jgi:predicted RNase H-like HicB family nuclease
MGSFRYSVVLEWDEAEHLFVATVPALSIGTYGETRPEAKEKAREAIAVTIEGLRELDQPIPQPRSNPQTGLTEWDGYCN